jgi:hypothetical protein
MNSAMPSRQNQPFDASRIAPLTVIYVPYTFSGKGYAEWKHFVVLCHVDGHAICIKATTQVSYYTGNPTKLVGCVYLKLGTVLEFNQDTVVEPDNQFPIGNAEIEAAYADPRFRMFSLPADFREKLCEAVRNSQTLKWQPKKRLEAILGMK